MCGRKGSKEKNMIYLEVIDRGMKREMDTYKTGVRRVWIECKIGRKKTNN